MPPLKSIEQKQGAGSKRKGSKAVSKSSTRTCLLHTPPPKRQAYHLNHPSSPTPGHTTTLHLIQGIRERWAKEIVTCSHSPLLLQRPQQSLAWISYLASEQFLWTTKEISGLLSHKKCSLLGNKYLPVSWRVVHWNIHKIMVPILPSTMETNKYAPSYSIFC